MKTGLTRRAALALPMIGTALSARAADKWPNRPVKMICGFAPGGGADITARVMSARFADVLGQQFVVENRTGASGIIAEEYVAKATPDGYTLLTDSSGHGTNPTLYSKLTFDMEKDFTPISLVLQGPNVLVVNPQFPAHTVQDVIDLAKAKPGQLNYASSGNGTSQTMAAELFKAMTKTDIVAIQYRGGAPALVDVAGGQVPIMFGYISSSMPHIKSGSVRPIAVTGTKRSPLFPDIPTVAETVPDYAVYEWNALFGPPKLPPDIVARIHQETVDGIKSPDVKDKLLPLGAELVGGSPAQLRDFVHSEIVKWSKIIKDAGIHID